VDFYRKAPFFEPFSGFYAKTKFGNRFSPGGGKKVTNFLSLRRSPSGTPAGKNEIAYAPLAGRPARQGSRCIWSQARGTAAPLSDSPAQAQPDSVQQMLFDKLSAPNTAFGALSGCRKSLKTFPTACKNAVTFPPLRGGKVRASLAGILAQQGFRGI